MSIFLIHHLPSNCSSLYRASFIPRHFSSPTEVDCSSLFHAASSFVPTFIPLFSPITEDSDLQSSSLPARMRALMGHRPAMTSSAVCFRKVLVSINNSAVCRDENGPSAVFQMSFYPGKELSLCQRRRKLKDYQQQNKYSHKSFYQKEQLKALFPTYHSHFRLK